jgi:transposase-like protein
LKKHLKPKIRLPKLGEELIAPKAQNNKESSKAFITFAEKIEQTVELDRVILKLCGMRKKRVEKKQPEKEPLKESFTETAYTERFEGTLEEIARKGAQKMLQMAMEAELMEHIEKFAHLKDENNHRLVNRNGHGRERTIQTGIGPLTIKQPRVDDRQLAEEERFESMILPKYLRRAPSIDNLIPWLYLKGVSTGDFSDALEAILGKGNGVSAATVSHLKQKWAQEYQEWCQQDFSDKEIYPQTREQRCLEFQGNS